MKSILLVKKLLGLVEMTFGLVNASFSLPEWQAVKMVFFCTLPTLPALPSVLVVAAGQKHLQCDDEAISSHEI